MLPWFGMLQRTGPRSPRPPRPSARAGGSTNRSTMAAPVCPAPREYDSWTRRAARTPPSQSERSTSRPAAASGANPCRARQCGRPGARRALRGARTTPSADPLALAGAQGAASPPATGRPLQPEGPRAVCQRLNRSSVAGSGIPAKKRSSTARGSGSSGPARQNRVIEERSFRASTGPRIALASRPGVAAST